MKQSHLIALATILVLGAFWFAFEVKKKPVLPNHPLLDQNKDTATAHPISSRSSTRMSSSAKRAEVDWPGVAADLGNRSKQIDQFKPSPAVDERIKQLSKKELLAASSKVMQYGLSARDQMNLLRYLHTLLVQLDPKAFCLNENGIFMPERARLWWEQFALAEWTRQSPSEAIAWLDSVAKNSRTPKQVTALEHNLFSSLIIADFEQAKARFLATPSEDRLGMIKNFDGIGSYWTAEDFQTVNLTGRFIELARLQGPASGESFITFVLSVRGEQDRPAGISRIQDHLKDWEKGYQTWLPASTVADYFDKINPTPREQELCLDQIVAQFKNFNSEGDPSAFRKRYQTEVRELRSGKE